MDNLLKNDLGRNTDTHPGMEIEASVQKQHEETTLVSLQNISDLKTDETLQMNPDVKTDVSSEKSPVMKTDIPLEENHDKTTDVSLQKKVDIKTDVSLQKKSGVQTVSFEENHDKTSDVSFQKKPDINTDVSMQKKPEMKTDVSLQKNPSVKIVSFEENHDKTIAVSLQKKPDANNAVSMQKKPDVKTVSFEENHDKTTSVSLERKPNKKTAPLKKNPDYTTDVQKDHGTETESPLQQNPDMKTQGAVKADHVGKESGAGNKNNESKTGNTRLGVKNTANGQRDSGHTIGNRENTDNVNNKSDGGIKRTGHKGSGDDVNGKTRFKRDKEHKTNASKHDETLQTDTKRRPSDSQRNHLEGDEPEGESGHDNGGACSWFTFSPACCQRFRNPKWLLFVLCWASGIQGMIINGFVNVVITTIEKRFGFSSTESGTIVSSFDIASAICLLPVSYIGGLSVKPRYVSVGMVAVGVGAFLFGLPRFTTGLYTFDLNHDILCTVDSNVTDACGSTFSGSNISNYRYLFICALLIIGAGASPFYTLGVTYLDDSLPKGSSSLYIGIFHSMNIFGTAVGYLVGGEFLNIWTDVGSVELSSIAVTPDNRKWVGAWWLGFFLSAGLTIIAAVPMAGFPKEMPGTKKFRKEKAAELYGRKRSSTDDGTTRKASLRRMLTSLKRLLTNPTFIFVSLSSATEAMAVAGFATFAPKFLEAQFAQTSANAAQFVGYAAIPAGGGATILGGYLVKRLDPRVPKIIKACSISCAIGLVLLLIFLVQCDSMPFAGINVGYNNPVIGGSITKNLEDSCNSNCGCSEDDYQPVCGRNGVAYFSPCYAGCQARVPSSSTRFTNCTCVSTPATDYQAEFTSCETQCSLMPLFLVVFAVLMFFTFIIGIPGVTVILRSVNDEDRNLAMGVQYLMLRCLGSIPGPIIFGQLIDQSCLLWQKGCDGEGSCFFYDSRILSLSLMCLGMVLKSLSLLFFLLAFLFYKPQATKLNQVEDVPPPKHTLEGESGAVS